MTFSIAASIPKTGELCIGTATCFVAVGDRVPKIIPNVGAIAVQASPNSKHKKIILDLLKKGQSMQEAVNQVLKRDKKREERQIIVINTKGQSYIYSGNKTISISDSFIGNNFAIAGNMLASQSVVPAIANAFKKKSQYFLPKRIVHALLAGEKKGGDKRGRLSAAIFYSKPKSQTMIMRIDYSKDPLKDLLKAVNLRYSKKNKDIFSSLE